MQCLVLCFQLLLMVTVHGGHFRGGSLSFRFINDTEIQIRSLLGWTLGLGSCGPNCNASRIGTSTSVSRVNVLQSTAPDYLGNWTKEVKTEYTNIDITREVTAGFTGRLAGMNKHLQWELESGVFDMSLDSRVESQDVILEGNYWTRVNPLQSRKGDPSHARYHLQIKISTGVRNDTGKPNNSPVVLFKPEYSIRLNDVTEIQLPTMDPDGDVVYCGDARFVEAGDLKQMKAVNVQRMNCSILIDASERNGFVENGTVAVLVKVMDFNAKTITISSEKRRPFETSISAIPVQFLVRTLRTLQKPVFVEPTPDDNHKFEVYAGSRLKIELFAQPHQLSTESIEEITVTHIQQLDILLSPLSYDSKRGQDGVKVQVVTWDTTQNDLGTYILQATPVDTAGINGRERNYIVTIKDANLTDSKQDLTPIRGDFTCLLKITCTVPVMFSPGMKVTEVVVVNSTLPGVEIDPLRQDGTSVYRTELRVLGTESGDQDICLNVTGHSNRFVVTCMTLSIIPPDPCHLEPCGHTGDCVSSWDSYHCVCLHGFTGPDCRTAIDFCDPSPCMNGGTCYFIRSRFFCKCVEPWTGTTCNTGPSTSVSTATTTTAASAATTTTRRTLTDTTTSTESSTSKTEVIVPQTSLHVQKQAATTWISTTVTTTSTTTTTTTTTRPSHTSSPKPSETLSAQNSTREKNVEVPSDSVVYIAVSAVTGFVVGVVTGAAAVVLKRFYQTRRISVERGERVMKRPGTSRRVNRA